MAGRRYIGIEPGVLVWAVAWDLFLGDMPEEVDPRVLTVRAAKALERNAPRNSRLARGVYGAAAALALPYTAWTATRWLLGATARAHEALYREMATVLLKGTISLRATAESLRESEATLHARATSPEPQGRTEDAVRLVSDGGSPPTPSTDDESRTVSRAISRLARDLRENVVGPLLYFSLFGVPGAVAYRVVQAVGEQWGNKVGDPLSTAARRVESIVNFLPALLAGVFLAAAARALEGRGAESWDASRREARERRRADGGWTEGALAGALDVRIGDEEPDGPGVVHPEGRAPRADDLPRARRLFLGAAAGAVGVFLLKTALRRAAQRR